MRVEGDVDPRLPLLVRLPVELLHRDVDVVRRDIDLAGVDDRVELRDRARDALDVAKLLQCRPPLVLAPPSRARRQPYGEGFREVLVWVLLRVPPLDVPHVVPAEGYRTIVVAVRAEEWSEQPSPLRSRVESICIVEHMAGFVAHVHHDLPLALERVHRLLELPQLRVGQIERDAEHRLLIGTSPLIGQVADPTELFQAAPLDLPI